MRLFLYEHLTGGGLFSQGTAAADVASLYEEGAAMVAALATDFAALRATEVTVLRDVRFELGVPLDVCVRDVETAAGHRRELAQAAARSDWTIVIAPEIDSQLTEQCRRVADAGGRLLGTRGRGLAIACDKHLTAEHLRAAGVPAPRGWAIEAGAPWPNGVRYPAVIKPRNGAGSLGVQLLRAAEEAVPRTAPLRLEEYCPGESVSVAVLCGPAGRFPLPPCRQHLSDDGRFKYLGGSLPIAPALADRARRLAEPAVAALPDALGYIGVDLVLGSDHRGADDFVIEVNPRMTTSYVGLRAAARSNLAAALLDVAEGRPPSLSFAFERVEFEANGRVQVSAASGAAH